MLMLRPVSPLNLQAVPVEIRIHPEHLFGRSVGEFRIPYGRIRLLPFMNNLVSSEMVAGGLFWPTVTVLYVYVCPVRIEAELHVYLSPSFCLPPHSYVLLPLYRVDSMNRYWRMSHLKLSYSPFCILL